MGVQHIYTFLFELRKSKMRGDNKKRQASMCIPGEDSMVDNSRHTQQKHLAISLKL